VASATKPTASRSNCKCGSPNDGYAICFGKLVKSLKALARANSNTVTLNSVSWTKFVHQLTCQMQQNIRPE
jgi:hypothetical protein